MQRLRDLDAGDVRGGDPARALPHDRAALDEHPDDLFDEERVALGAREDEVADRVGQRLDLEQVGHEGPAVGLRQGLEGDLGERLAEQLPRVADEGPAGRVRLGAHRRDEQDRAAGAASGMSWRATSTDAGSAQWMSSQTTTTGPRAARPRRSRCVAAT